MRNSAAQQQNVSLDGIESYGAKLPPKAVVYGAAAIALPIILAHGAAQFCNHMFGGISKF